MSALLRKLLLIVLRLGLATAAVSGFFVVTQDFHIFPILYSSKIANQRNQPPPEVDEFRIHAADGTPVTVWRAAVDKKSERAVALLFHGNGDTLSSFLGVQAWLQELDITSYSMEYRGYNGRDSGWPSEEGFYQDADAAIELIKRETEGQGRLIVLGSSIGTGIASYVAERYRPRALILLSPYTSLPELVSELPFFGFLARFLKYEFPTVSRISKLSETCVIVAHGRRDGTIPAVHSERLQRQHPDAGDFRLLIADNAGHNDLLVNMHQQLASELQQCLSTQDTLPPRPF